MLQLIVVGLLASQISAKTLEQFAATESGIDSIVPESEPIRENPCAHVTCGAGFECELDEDEQATCVCIRKCASISSDVQVCTTMNETFGSECEFHRERCLCEHGDSECTDPQHVSAMMDYYGKCKELPPCEEEEMSEYPHRMRDWLFYVMEELDERSDLTTAAHGLLQEAKEQEHRWVLPVIWKFCELDISGDRFVNSAELLPISAPLKPLEHCTGPFLEHCDEDNNGKIDIIEWGTCLQLDPDEIEDRCDALRD